MTNSKLNKTKRGLPRRNAPATQTRSIWEQVSFVRGQMVVELLVAFGLASILLPAIVGGFISGSSGKVQQEQRVKAVGYLQEGMEAVRSIREADWANISNNNTYHPVKSGSAWLLSPGSETLGDFTRSVSVEDVNPIDASIKKITVSVSWNNVLPSNVTSVFYLTRYLANTTHTETTQADFNAGVLNNVQVTNVEDGEIKLSNNNKAKWCSPAFTTDSGGGEITISLPDGPPKSVAAFADSGSTDTPNTVFTATAPDDSTSIKMAYLDVTANSQYPTPTLKGIFTLDPAKYSNPSYIPSGIGLDNTFKTNDVKAFTSAAGKKYALLATNKSDREVVVVQVNDGSGDAYQDPVNKIYKYWTFFNTKIYGSAFNSPTANSAEVVNAGDNNGYQGTPANAYTSDGVSATDTNSGSNTGTNCGGTDKDKHRFYNYDFSVPSGAAINGIEVNLTARADSTTGTPKICIQLSWDGGTSWTAAKTTNNLTTSLASYTLGGSGDTWGRSWNDTNFSNANFRVRVINVASNTSRDFSLDYIGAKVYYNGGSTNSNDYAPFNRGAKSITILGTRGYVASGGYLYVFDLSNIDTKTVNSGLDQIGCRIELDGYDCSPGTGTDQKYAAGEVGGSWSNTTSPAHNDCSDGGNIELYANNDLNGVTVAGNNYIFVAVGAGTNPEFEIVNASSVPDGVSNPTISNSSCGRISGGNSSWKVTGSLDFNSKSGTEEAANSVYAKSDGTRAYVSSNGGIDGNNDGLPDSHQFYVINTSTKSAPAFLSGTPSTGATSGYYDGDSTNIELFPRRSLTVLNGQRAVLVGQDGNPSNGIEPKEYQVLNIENESSPSYCGGVNFAAGFNDLTSVTETDGDNFVYMVANTLEKQLKIIEGGPDSGIYVPSGSFISKIFTTATQAAFNRFVANIVQPANTSIKMQVAVAPENAGDCNTASYDFVGPDGTSASYFTPVAATISGSLPVGVFGNYQNPEKCFRFKSYLETTDFNQTPEFKDATVNYSP